MDIVEVYAIVIASVFVLPFIFAIVLIIVAEFYSFKIFRHAKKYPSVFNKIRFHYSSDISRSFAELGLATKHTFLLEWYSKDKFDETFNQWYNYKEILKTKDKSFIRLVNKSRKIYMTFILILRATGILAISSIVITLSTILIQHIK